MAIFFAGIPSQTLNKYFNFTGIVLTGTNVSYGYELLSSSIISRFILTSTGIVQSFFVVRSDRELAASTSWPC